MSGTVRRLLIVKTSSIGDVAHALPAADIVKRSHREIEIGWVVRKRCADLVRGNPNIDRVYEIENKPSFGGLAALARELRREQYDMVWDMQGLALSGVISRLSDAPRRVGLDLNREGNRWFLNEPVVPARAQRRRHAIDILRGFLPTVGIDPDVEWPSLCYLASNTQPVAGLIDEHAGRKTTIALNVGASSVYKQWLPEQWAQLAGRLIDARWRPVLIGGPPDIGIAEGVLASFGAKHGNNELSSIVGKTTLPQTAAVLNRCAALVTADTGPMHIAAALRVPIVALFGPTDPVKTGPYGTASRAIKHECCTTNHRRPVCHGAATCMRTITVDEVYEALTSVLEDTGFQRC